MAERPLLISDCDEVLLHMVVPFSDWLDSDHDIHFDLTNSNWGEALRHKECGSIVESELIWKLLNDFFITEMHRQQPIDGAVEAMLRLSQIADVVILTNLQDMHNERRREQLRAVGLDFPVVTNQGGKGEALAALIAERKPSAAVFVDDLAHQHGSIAEHNPGIWQLHLVGEPILQPRIDPAPFAHARIDRWSEAEGWISGRLLSGETAPLFEDIAKGIGI